MRKSALALVIVAPALLAGCGTATQDRTLGGAALGAGFGSALGLVIGPIGVLPGAAIGAVAGSTTGAFTSPDQVDYGPPIWRERPTWDIED
jgi:hypothetical protein